MEAFLHNQFNQIGEELIVAGRGFPQGSVLFPYLFNVYLEKAIESSQILRNLRNSDDLIAYVDNIVLQANRANEARS